MSDYKPPFHMTDKMTSLIAEISEQVGRITVLQEGTISPHLRRENRIRTIHSSLAIEHNSLSLEQVTAILMVSAFSEIPMRSKRCKMPTKPMN